MDNDLTNLKMLLGGADKVEGILSDGELTEFINESTNVYRAASRAAFAITAYYTHQATVTVDILSTQNTARANAFRELAIELGKQADSYTDASDESDVSFVYIRPDKRHQTFIKKRFDNGYQRR